MDKRLKILWLASWYPNKMDGFIGDFIQRHARAASIYNDIYVIHVENYKGALLLNDTKDIIDGVKEHILYLKYKNTFLSKILLIFKWLKAYKLAVEDYIKENGLPDIVHVHVPNNAGVIALWIKRRFKIPYLVTEHHDIYNVASNPFAKRNSLFKMLTKVIIKHTDLFLPVSDYLGKAVNKLVSDKKFTIVPNVVDTNLFFYTEKTVSKFRFIHVSNLSAKKNFLGIVHAIKMLETKYLHFELVVIGNPKKEILTIVKELNLQNVITFLGELPYSYVAIEIQKSDALILFSYIETFGCVIIEAFACGIPVIASNVGAIPELVTKKNGLLVESKNEMDLAKAMENMIINYKDYDCRIIAKEAERNFSYTVIGKKLDDLYRNI